MYQDIKKEVLTLLFTWHEDGTIEQVMKLARVDLAEYENPTVEESDNLVEMPNSSNEPPKLRKISTSTDEMPSKKPRN